MYCFIVGIVSFKYFMAFPAAYTTQPNKVEILLRVGSILLAFLVYYISSSMFYYVPNLLVTTQCSKNGKKNYIKTAKLVDFKFFFTSSPIE